MGPMVMFCEPNNSLWNHTQKHPAETNYEKKARRIVAWRNPQKEQQKLKKSISRHQNEQ